MCLTAVQCHFDDEEETMQRAFMPTVHECQCSGVDDFQPPLGPLKFFFNVGNHGEWMHSSFFFLFFFHSHHSHNEQQSSSSLLS